MTPSDTSSVEVAVAIGRLEEGQRHVLEGIGELKTSVAGVIGKVEKNSADIAVLQQQHSDMASDQKAIKETIAPIKLHPIVITGIVLSPIIAVASLVTTVIVSISV